MKSGKNLLLPLKNQEKKLPGTREVAGVINIIA